MSSLRNAVSRRTYLERSQPEVRRGLGLLEKHKDYLERAKDYSKKKAAAAELHEKARLRNPDEFDHKMIKRRLHGGKLVLVEAEASDQQKVASGARDIKFLEMQKSKDLKKVEKMRELLHLVDAPKLNKHTLFIDDDDSDDSTTSAGSDDRHGRRCPRTRPSKAGGGLRGGRMRRRILTEANGSCSSSSSSSSEGEPSPVAAPVAGLSGVIAAVKHALGRAVRSESGGAEDAVKAKATKESAAAKCGGSGARTLGGRKRRKEVIGTGEQQQAEAKRRRTRLAAMLEEEERLAVAEGAGGEGLKLEALRSAAAALQTLQVAAVDAAGDGAKQTREEREEAEAVGYPALLRRQKRSNNINAVVEGLELQQNLLKDKNRRIVRTTSAGKSSVRWLPNRKK